MINDDLAYIRQLERELNAAKTERDAKGQQLALCYDRMNRAEAERDALRQDAERYRWLRKYRGGSREEPWAMIFDSELEEFIDAAMKGAA